MTGWYFTRARLRPDLSAARLARALLGHDPDATVAAAHRLVWTLFGDRADRQRDFLWREQTSGELATTTFYFLSARPPTDPFELFELDQPKPFAPRLRPGDRLRFMLRANPVVTRPGPAGVSRRHDVVMDALHRAGVASGTRAERRFETAQEAGAKWLEAQGQRYGFQLVRDRNGAPRLRIDGYAQRVIPRPRAKPAIFSVLDFEGELEVEDPETFVAALQRGFGKAKAWGCGLMLVRRA